MTRCICHKKERALQVRCLSAFAFLRNGTLKEPAADLSLKNNMTQGFQIVKHGVPVAIEKMAYALYGLTPAEIAIVEGKR